MCLIILLLMSCCHFLYFVFNFDLIAIVKFAILNWLFADYVACIGRVLTYSCLICFCEVYIFTSSTPEEGSSLRI